MLTLSISMHSDPELLAGMAALGKLADAAKASLEGGRPEELAALMAQNFGWRRKMYGDAVVGATNLRAIEIAESCGLAAKFTGSGGALVCVNKSRAQWLDEGAEEEARRLFAGIFFEFVRVRPAAP